MITSTTILYRWSLILLLIVSVFSIAVESEQINPELSSLLNDIDSTIQIAKQNIWDQIEKDQPLWNFPPWLGTLFLSQYYFQLKALNITKDFHYPTKFNPQFLKQKLIREQESDGSWMQIVDLNKKHGLLDATIFNYWFLKDVGVSMDMETMRKARKFILDNGGIENAQVMTKYKLAAFGVYEWGLLPYVPLFIFKNAFPFYSYAYIKDYVAQWVFPHLTGLAYLRYHKTVFTVSRVCLQQLRTSRSDHCEEYREQYPNLRGFKNQKRDQSVDNLIEEIIKIKGPRGAFGGYTISTLLNLLSFKDYSLRYGTDNQYVDFFNANIEKSITFVEDNYFNRRVPYEGSLDDGRYWDTILATFALLQAGQNEQKLVPTIENLINTAVQQNGGIPYGHEFQYAPDIDDTAMLLMLYGKMKRANLGNNFVDSLKQQIKRTFNWLKINQNGDGGFPAFDKNKNDEQYKIIKYIFKLTRIDKSAQIFDPSCPDIVGHMLEAMGEVLTDSKKQQELISKAIQYLINTRKDGMWSGRWGINYVYAVGAVFPGLARIGYDLNATWTKQVIKRMQEVQQSDGGFGEDSEGYNIDKYCEGVSTATMTAWGLLAYIDAAYTPIPNIQNDMKRAAQYLLTNFKENGNKFYDRSVVGTGHRGLLNLQYPVYAYSFPLVALSRLRKLIKGEYHAKIDAQLTSIVNERLKTRKDYNEL